MSSYIHFFVRKNDTFTPIGLYGRSTKIYELFEGMAPWEQIAPVTLVKLNAAKERLREVVDARTEAIAKAQETIELIATFNNSINDKAVAIAHCQNELAELKLEINELNNARAYIGFLYDILDIAEYGTNANMMADACIYVGMECGHAVDVGDIKK